MEINDVGVREGDVVVETNVNEHPIIKVHEAINSESWLVVVIRV